MQESCKWFSQTVKKQLLIFFLILFLSSSVVLAKQYTQDYNDPITYSMGDLRWCKLNGICTLDTITVESIITGNLSVIGEVFNVTMNLVTWNITDSFNVGGNLQADNITATGNFIGDGSLITGITASSVEDIWVNETREIGNQTFAQTEDGEDIELRLETDVNENAYLYYMESDSGILGFRAWYDGSGGGVYKIDAIGGAGEIIPKIEIDRDDYDFDFFVNEDLNDNNITNIQCLELDDRVICSLDEINDTTDTSLFLINGTDANFGTVIADFFNGSWNGSSSISLDDAYNGGSIIQIDTDSVIWNITSTSQNFTVQTAGGGQWAFYDDGGGNPTFVMDAQGQSGYVEIGDDVGAGQKMVFYADSAGGYISSNAFLTLDPDDYTFIVGDLNISGDFIVGGVFRDRDGEINMTIGDTGINISGNLDVTGTATANEYCFQDTLGCIKNLSQINVTTEDTTVNNSGFVSIRKINVSEITLFNISAGTETSAQVSTTLHYTDCTADVTITQVVGTPMYASLYKYDISSIPSGATISSATFCSNSGTKTGAPDDDLTVERINNQTWDETVSCGNVQKLTYDNNEAETWDTIPDGGIGCVDLTAQFNADYDTSNSYFSFWLEDPDSTVDLSGCTAIGDTNDLDIGGLFNRVNLYSREAAALDATLEHNLTIVYTPPDVTSTIRFIDKDGNTNLALDGNGNLYALADFWLYTNTEADAKSWIGADGSAKFNSTVNITSLNAGSINSTGNITSQNVFLPQYIFSHTNATIPVIAVNEWTNLTFSQEDTDVKQGISHTYNDVTNHTFTIMEDGIYNIDYDLDIEDDSGTPTTIDVAGRMILANGTEVLGSVFETDITKQGAETELSHNFLVACNAGDVLVFQFVATDAQVQISTHGVFGEHPESATILMNKIANLP